MTLDAKSDRKGKDRLRCSWHFCAVPSRPGEAAQCQAHLGDLTTSSGLGLPGYKDEKEALLSVQRSFGHTWTDTV